MTEIQVLLDKLCSDDWWVRSNAIKGLLNHPEESYMQFIENGLKNNGNAILRNTSMEFYKAMGTRAVPYLINLLKNNDEEVRMFSANLMGDIKDRASVPSLLSALRDPKTNVRVAASEALGKIGDPHAIPHLRRLLDDEPWVAMSAITAIGDIGGEAALNILSTTCLQKEQYRGITFNAIEKAGNYNSIRCLTPFIERDDLRELALKAIVNIAEREKARPKPAYFTNLIPLLIELQGSVSPELKRSAFIALSWAEDVKGIPYFIDELGNEDLQEYALNGIISLGKKAVPAVIDALKDTAKPQRCILAKLIAMLGEHQALVQFAKDDDPEVRVEVVFAAGHLTTPRAVETLSLMLNDPEEEVRAAAQKALKNISEVM